MKNIKNISVIGTGVIGTGWILRFLACNKKVTAFDKNKKQIEYLKKGVFASNAQLVEKVRCIVEDLGSSILNPEQVRKKLKLKKHF